MKNNKALLIIFIGLGIFYTFSTNISAQSCSQVQPNMNLHVCGIPSGEFEFLKATTVNGGKQIQSNWCWAACVQTVLNYHGLSVSQIDVVTRIYGSPYVNEPANLQQTLNALSGWAPDMRGRFSAINAVSGASLQEIVTGLSNKHPLIVGLNNPGSYVGHAYVLTAIYFSQQYNNYGQVVGIIPQGVVLRDPYPYPYPYNKPDRQEMSWNEFQSRVNMAIKVWVTRL